MQSERIAIGCIKRPIGLDGFCAIEAFGTTFGTLRTPCTVLVGRNETSATEAVIGKIRLRPAGYQCRFEGRDDRTAIEGLRGQVIYIDGDALPGLPGNEFYHFELKGMDVVEDVGGTSIGKVLDVHNFPAGDTLEVMPLSGESIMVPLFGPAIAGIDKQNRRITVLKSFIEELLE